MAKGKKVSFSKLTHDVVREADEPLSAAEIQGRVNALAPITTKNPKSTIRNAITSSAMIISTGDGRFGWKPRLANGAIVRHTLSEAELVQDVLHWDDDLRDALWPTFFAPQMYDDRSPAKVTLPNEIVVEMPLIHFGHGVWGTRPPAPFWEWLNSTTADMMDHLIFHVIDSEERRHAVTFESREERNEEAVQQRNQELWDFAQKMKERSYGATTWEVTRDLLGKGFYLNPIPPDPFSEIWDAGMWAGRQFADDELDDYRPEDEPDPLVSALFERAAHIYNPEAPPNLPKEYDPAYGRRQARPSRKARRGSVTAYTFRVNHRAFPDNFGELLLAEDQTLEDLHLRIQSLFRWQDDHLYSFFILDEQQKPIEIGSPWSETTLHTHLIQLGALNLVEGQRILYLFDYGDNHEFDIEVVNINPLSPKGDYPKTLKYLGLNAPKQYSDDYY